MIGGLTAATKYFDSKQTTSSIPSGMSDGQLVLLAAQGGAGTGNTITPDNDNGVWRVSAGAWTKLDWDAAQVPRPQILVGTPATGDGGERTHGYYRLVKRTNGVLVERM